MTTMTVRYIVNDVDKAIAFYTTNLGFDVVMRPAPAFAMLSRGDLRLLLSAPGSHGGGGQILAGDRHPEPGGWNRFQLEVADLEQEMHRLRGAGHCAEAHRAGVPPISRSPQPPTCTVPRC